MTPTDKHVTRVTVKAYPHKTGASGRGYGKERKIVVTLAGDMIVLRPQGTRRRAYISIDTVYRVAVARQALAERATKRAAKARRGITCGG